MINKEGRILINKIEKRGWTILNGSYNNEGGWTYIGELGVIDYVVANEKAEEMIRKVVEMRENRIRSHPIRSRIRSANGRNKKTRKRF